MPAIAPITGGLTKAMALALGPQTFSQAFGLAPMWVEALAILLVVNALFAGLTAGVAAPSAAVFCGHGGWGEPGAPADQASSRHALIERSLFRCFRPDESV